MKLFRYKTRLGALLLLSVFAGLNASAQDSGKVLKIYLMTGQSNMDGTVGGNLAPATDFDKVSNGSAPSTNKADQNVFMWDFNSPQGDKTLDPNTSNSTWDKMHAYGDNGNAGNRWGAEIGMARTMYDSGARDFAIIKVAQSGMPNEAWVRYEDGAGKVTSNPNVQFQNCYYDLYCSVVRALQNLPEGYTSVEIAGLGYLQGEGNGNTNSAVGSSANAPGLTAERLGNLVNDLKTDLGKLSTNGVSVKTDGMKLVIGQIGENSNWSAEQKANAALTNTQHKDYASTNSDAAFVPGRGLPTGTQSTTGDVHYTADSQIILGERFADAFLNLGTYEKAETTSQTWNGGDNGNWNSNSWGTPAGTWVGAAGIAVFDTDNAAVSITEQTTTSGIKFLRNATVSSTGNYLTLAHNAEIYVEEDKTGTLNAAVNPTYGLIKTGQGSLVLNNASTNLLGMIVDIKEGTLLLNNVSGLTTAPTQGYTEGLGKFILHQGTTLHLGMATSLGSGIQSAIDVTGEATVQLNNSANTLRNITNSSSATNTLHIVSGGGSTQLFLSSKASNVVLQFDHNTAGGNDMSSAASWISGTFGGLQGEWNASSNGNFRIDESVSGVKAGLTLDVAEGQTYTFDNTLASATTDTTLTKKGKGTQILTGKTGFKAGGDPYRSSIRGTAGYTTIIDIQEGTLEVQSGINGDAGAAMEVKISDKGTFNYNTFRWMSEKVKLSGTGVLNLMQSTTLYNDFSNFTGTVQVNKGVTATLATNGTTVRGKIVGVDQTSILSLTGTGQTIGDTSGEVSTFVDQVLVKGNHSFSMINVALGSTAQIEVASGQVATLGGAIGMSFTQGGQTQLVGSGTFNLLANTIIELDFNASLLNSVTGNALELTLFEPGKWTFDSGFDARTGLKLAASDGFNVVLDESNFLPGQSWMDTGKVHLTVTPVSVPEPTSGTLLLGSLTCLVLYRKRRREGTCRLS